ncbi:hypothetical protein CSV73_08710 [Sporosarcina sp. P1]|nr:hypothetical protein CSV73_08710 [Sporosarcina sp. P1]
MEVLKKYSFLYNVFARTKDEEIHPFSLKLDVLGVAFLNLKFQHKEKVVTNCYRNIGRIGTAGGDSRRISVSSRPWTGALISAKYAEIRQSELSVVRLAQAMPAGKRPPVV